MLDTLGYKDTFRISNIYCFSMATMVAHTGLKVALYMHGLSGMALYKLYHQINLVVKDQYYLLT